MTKPAAIRADFADFRQVKSRKVAQLIFEVPLEQLPEVMEVLGWPRPDGNIPVGIARLVAEIGPDDVAKRGGQSVPSSATPVTPSASGEGQDIRRTYTRSQMAAILCRDVQFQFWIAQQYGGGADPVIPSDVNDAAIVANGMLKDLLDIKSKSILDTDPLKGEAWDKLYNSFKYREMAR